ncbi:hypothetical protein TYRP_005898 [Tyrophagus putrescentiae]|nr:hypothetical protein TYRP_005898 [Tyrophagus putrescentiae]
MLKFVILSTAVVLCSASYGGGGGGGYGYHPIEAAIYSNHHTSVYPVPSTRYAKPTYVDVPAGMTPVYINFQSQSSPVYVKQQHYGMSGSYQHSHSYDEPHRLVHEVTKPIQQIVKETIVPSRKVVQTIQPVHESVETKVYKGTHGYGGYGKMGGGGGGGGGGGYGKMYGGGGGGGGGGYGKMGGGGGGGYGKPKYGGEMAGGGYGGGHLPAIDSVRSDRSDMSACSPKSRTCGHQRTERLSRWAIVAM